MLFELPPSGLLTNGDLNLNIFSFMNELCCGFAVGRETRRRRLLVWELTCV